MKTALVTGAGGFIGRRLADRLCERGNLRVLKLGRSVGPDGLQIALEDLSRSFWSGRQIDAIDRVFHLGGYAPKNWAQANLAKPVIESTINGTLALLESLPAPPRHFVYISSVDVYRAQPESTVDESSPLGPETLHGASKLFAEQLVRNFARQAGSRYSILRLGHIYGPGEERYEKLVPNLIRAMLRGSEPELSGDGSTERDFLYVDDAVAAIAAAARRDVSADPINVVSDESLSILRIARCIAQIAGYRGSFRFAGENGNSLRFCNAVMKRELGVAPSVSIEDGLAREVAAFREKL